MAQFKRKRPARRRRVREFLLRARSRALKAKLERWQKPTWRERNRGQQQRMSIITRKGRQW